MEVQYKAEFDCKLVNSSYGVKMFINGVENRFSNI